MEGLQLALCCLHTQMWRSLQHTLNNSHNASNGLQSLRQLIAEETGKQPPEMPPTPALAVYGEMQLLQTAAMADNFAQLHVLSKPFVDRRPLSMERNGLASGVVHCWCSLMAVSLFAHFCECTASCRLHVEICCHICRHTGKSITVPGANSVLRQASVVLQDVCEVQRAVRQLAQIQSL
jgi:hypothetical protein